MTVTSLYTTKWDNGDGLRVKFPGDAQVRARGGVYPFGTKTMVECFITLASLPTVASGNQQIVLENVVFPNGAFIENVDVLVTKETTGTNANLDLGLVKYSDRTTELDFNGFLAAADDFNSGTDLGGFISYSRGAGTVTTEGGALIGTQLAFDGVLTANAETADWTAGIVRVRVFYSMQRSADV